MSEKNVSFFNKNKYLKTKSGLLKETIDIITQYALFDEIQRFTPEGSFLNGNNQVPGAHSRYADPVMESLLLHLQPVVEKNTGLKLYPTYSYYRVYRPGDKLGHHVDKPACEISITLSFQFDYKEKKNYKWPIYIDGSPINLSPGEMAIYRGCELDHWREPLEAPENSYHVQAFLHYVDANGPHKEQKFDGRESIGTIIKSGEKMVPTSPKDNPKKYIEFL
jgi:hypothetical protein